MMVVVEGFCKLVVVVMSREPVEVFWVFVSRVRVRMQNR
jgi:hypothetical protein